MVGKRLLSSHYLSNALACEFWKWRMSKAHS